MSLCHSTTSHSRLERRAKEIVEAFDGKWDGAKGMCRCRAHNDRSPSLAIGLGKQAIQFDCFAGCSSGAVLAAFAGKGIRARELFDGTGGAITPMARAEGPDRNALRLWRKAEVLAGTLADRYLASRKIDLRSPDLRYHARTPLGRKPDLRFLPAMLAAIRINEGIIAVPAQWASRPSRGRAKCPRWRTILRESSGALAGRIAMSK